MVEKYNEFLDLHYRVVEDRDGITEINLRDLFKKPWDEQPWLVESYNCIYLITNLVNGKVYVGQATDFYRRFRIGGLDHLSELRDPYNTLVLQKALRKYKPKNFKVEILKINLDELNPDEIYFVNYFGSYINSDRSNGYNMTLGGDDCSNLHIPEVYETNRRNHGGVLAWNTKESYLNNRVGSIMNSINSVVDTIEAKNLKLNERNYLESSSHRHIYRVLDILDTLIERSLLSDELISIFSYFKENGVSLYDFISDEEYQEKMSYRAFMISMSYKFSFLEYYINNDYTTLETLGELKPSVSLKAFYPMIENIDCYRKDERWTESIENFLNDLTKDGDSRDEVF